jgi:hypothetical protein
MSSIRIQLCENQLCVENYLAGLRESWLSRGIQGHPNLKRTAPFREYPDEQSLPLLSTVRNSVVIRLGTAVLALRISKAADEASTSSVREKGPKHPNFAELLSAWVDGSLQ